MRDGKKIVITYGTYDMFHYGHEALLRRAKELGDYLIVGVTSDDFDRVRGKLNVHQSLTERMHAVEETGIADLVIAEEYQGQKIADIRKYGVDIFAIGSDWEGKFDHLKRYCDVVYLPRTQGVSSTALRAKATPQLNLGIVGNDYIASRFARECAHVSDINVVASYAFEGQDAAAFCAGLGKMAQDVERMDSVEELCQHVQGVYISASPARRAELIRTALTAGCHVLCEGPLFLSQAQGEELYALAQERNLVLMQADKTLYLPAFERLRWLLESGAVGEIKDIRASFTQAPAWLDKTDVYQGSFYDLASYVLLPATTFLGNDPADARLICSYEGDFCSWTKCELLYPHASATLIAGRGMKSEGDMVITGTLGYVYVPAPWWKTDYFEIRGEDLRDTKKYYFECAGEGHRYEAFEFMRRIHGGAAAGGADTYMPMQSKEDVLAVTRLVERFVAGDVIRLQSGAYHFGGGETVTDR